MFFADSEIFYLRYQTIGDESTSLTGNMNDSNNLAQIEQRVCIDIVFSPYIYISETLIDFDVSQVNTASGLSSEGVELIQGFSQTALIRRRRSLYVFIYLLKIFLTLI